MQFDLVVIGSGPGGYKSALTAAQLGARVALVEKGLPGGCCLNQGCVPKKTLLHLASLIEDVNQLQARGLHGKVRGDFAAAHAHKDEVVNGIRENFPVLLQRLGVRVIYGVARFADSRHIVVTPNDGSAPVTLEAERAIIATGAAPREHPQCPADGTNIVHSSHFMLDLRDLPESVLCVGGGPIGVELGFLLHQFGARVTVVEQSDRLLNKPNIPERASAALERKFARLGITVRKEVTVASQTTYQDGIEIALTDGSRERYTRVLVAIGRRPVSEDLGLSEIGVGINADGFIETNEFLETSVPGIYAVGDVKPGPMTANAALHDAKIAAANAVKGNQLPSNYYRVPTVIDSALEIAIVGLSEEQAESAGFEVDVARVNLGASAKARARNDVEGFIEAVHDEQTGQLLGGCVVGTEAGEQIHMLAAACQSDRGLWFFMDMNYSHPSWTEELENAIGPLTSALSQSGRELFLPGIYALKK